jgi:SAM-dependent methyltransferase
VHWLAGQPYSGKRRAFSTLVLSLTFFFVEVPHTRDMAASGFELPFQWDDGTFVSPFVRSSGETLQDVGEFLAEFLIRHVAQLSTETAAVEVVVTDLGCGDGQALFDLCPKIAAAMKGAVTIPLRVFGRGVDLDEDLVAVAAQRVSTDGSKVMSSDAENNNAALTPSLNPAAVRYAFEVADICAMSADDIAAPSADHVVRIHIVFVFLLTTALEQLQPLVEKLLPNVEFFVSNSWTVPYLEGTASARGKVGSCFVYRDAGRDQRTIE